MKKIISLVLAAVLCCLPLGICASAADDDVPSEVCYITLPESYAYTVTPCEGYDVYVVKGQDFKFTVTPNDGYALDMAMVYYYPTKSSDTSGNEGYFQQELTRNPESIVYTIDVVETDLTIDVEQVMDQGKASMFRSLMEFLHRLFIAIAKILGIPLEPAAV